MYLEYTPLTEFLLPYFLTIVYFCIAMWAIAPSRSKGEESPVQTLDPDIVWVEKLEDLWVAKPEDTSEQTMEEARVVANTKRRSKTPKITANRRSSSDSTQAPNLEVA